MSLKSVVIKKSKVEADGIEFTVRGLSLNDITSVVHDFRDEITELFGKLSAGLDAGDALNEEKVGAILLQRSPRIAATLIAAASGDASDECIEIAASLPFPVQLDALKKIGELTFTTEDSLKKTVAVVMEAMKGLTGQLAALRA